jgi:malate dehydrogenase (oxaloacetate-decarboxylating)(NADP+)
MVSRRLEVMHDILDRARRDPKRIVFPEGEEAKVLRAAKILVDEGIAHPVLLGRPEVILPILVELDLSPRAVTVVQPRWRSASTPTPSASTSCGAATA